MLAGLVVAAVLAGCGGDAITDPTKLRYAPELGVDFGRMTKTPSGLWLEDTTVGTGAAAASGQTIRVLYRGWLPNGAQFDARTDANNPLVFQLGVGQVIRGWDEGVVGMRVGGVRKLVIPPSLAYGDREVGTIPAHATLIFEIRLLAVN